MHVMLDLETFGTRPGAALRSIGAVLFPLQGGSIGAEFYRNIDQQSCLDHGLTLEPDTLAWWERQSAEAQAALLTDAEPLGRVVDDFHDWFRHEGGVYVWSHGANFDEPLWGAAAHAVGARVPWKFWNARCTRTLYFMAGFDSRAMTREGTHHNALDDAKHQARCVQAAYQQLHSTTAPV